MAATALAVRSSMAAMSNDFVAVDSHRSDAHAMASVQDPSELKGARDGDVQWLGHRKAERKEGTGSRLCRQKFCSCMLKSGAARLKLGGTSSHSSLAVAQVDLHWCP